MIRKALFFLTLTLGLFVSVSCAVSEEEAVRNAVATVVKSGTPMPTWTSVPPTVTPRPTATATPLPTAPPFTGWIKYDGDGQELARHNITQFVPPPPLAGDNGERWVHYANGKDDFMSEPTPWWKGLLVLTTFSLIGIVVLLTLVYLVVLVPNKRMQNAMMGQFALSASNQPLLTTGRDPQVAFQDYLAGLAQKMPAMAESIRCISERAASLEERK